MSKRIGLDELRTLLENAIIRQDRAIAECTGETNPQLIEVKHKAVGARNAYQDVLDALNGDAMFMRSSGKLVDPVLF